MTARRWDGPRVRDIQTLGLTAHASTTYLALSHWLVRAGGRVRAVVVDLKLGGAEGTTVLDHLAKGKPAMRRGLLSGEVRKGQLQAAVAAGQAHALLTKPWDKEALSEALAPFG